MWIWAQKQLHLFLNCFHFDDYFIVHIMFTFTFSSKFLSTLQNLCCYQNSLDSHCTNVNSLKAGVGYIRKKIASVLALVDLHSSSEHLVELLKIISYLIGLSNKLWIWLTPLISSVAIWFLIWGIQQTLQIIRKFCQNLSNIIWILK